jgi:hypothetical protein
MEPLVSSFYSSHQFVESSDQELIIVGMYVLASSGNFAAF